jgi:O-antigen ligase
MTKMLRRRLGPTAEAMIVLTVVGCPLALGGVHWQATVIAALFAAFAAILLSARTRPLHTPPFFGLILLLVAGWVGIQLIPLPIAVHKLVAPRSFELLQISRNAVVTTEWHSLSLDPATTLLEVTKFGLYALVLIVVHDYVRRLSRRNRLVFALIFTGVLLIVVGLIGVVVAPGAGLLFYSPISGQAGGIITTTFINANHSGAFLGICALVSLGVALSNPSQRLKKLFALCSLLLALGVALSTSKGAILAFAASGLTFAVVALRRRSGNSRVWIYVALSSAGLLAVMGIFVLSVGPKLSTRLAILPSALSMLRQNVWVGVGKGAFFSTFPQYMNASVPGGLSFSHLENQYLQLPIEMGLPVATLLFAAAIVSWYRWWRASTRSLVALSLCCSLLLLAIHATVDFNLETLGLAVPAAALAGMLSSLDRAKRSHARNRSRWILLASAIVVASLAMLVVFNPPESWSSRLAQYNTLDISRAKAHIKEYPADYRPHLAIARALGRRRDPRAIRWLNRALYLNPRSAEVHAESAALLLRFGRRSQALVEIRATIANSANPRPMIWWALPHVRTAADLDAILPEKAAIYADALTILLLKKRFHLASELSDIAVKKKGGDSVKLIHQALLAKLALIERSKRAARNPLLSQARTLARTLHKRAPDESSYLLYARAYRGAQRNSKYS